MNTDKKLFTFTYIILFTGTLDLLLSFLDAFIFNNAKPSFILMYIASGLIGTKAFDEGYWGIILGLFIHFFITSIFTLLFYFFYEKIQKMISNRIILGFTYGIIVWCIMNLILIPLSSAPSINWTIMNLFKSILIQVVGIGFPIVLLIENYLKNKIQDDRSF